MLCDIEEEALAFMSKCDKAHFAQLERIFSKISYVNDGGCWVINGKIDSYPIIKIIGTRTNVRPHRFLLQCQGICMDGLHSRHKCDNRRCVNPKHLEAGTAKDNVYDAISRGRMKYPPITNWALIMKSRNHHWQKLSFEDVVSIRKRLKSGEKQKTIAQDFNVSHGAISKIALGQRWGNAE